MKIKLLNFIKKTNNNRASPKKLDFVILFSQSLPLQSSTSFVTIINIVLHFFFVLFSMTATQFVH